MQIKNGITIFASAMFLPVLILAMLNVGAVQGVFTSPTLHTITMIIIFLVGAAVWYLAIKNFLRSGSLRLLLIGSGLFVGAVLLLLHGLTFIAVGLMGEAVVEWHNRLGLLAVGVFIFLTIGFSERTISAERRKSRCLLLCLSALILAALLWFLGDSASRAEILVAATAGLWTPLGRFLQIASILLLTIAAIRYLHGAFLIRSEAALAFATGIVLLVMSELTSAAVQVSYDSFFWVAHLWLLMGFLSFLWGSAASGQSPHEVLVPELNHSARTH